MFGPMLSDRSSATAAAAATGSQSGLIPRVLRFLWDQCNGERGGSGSSTTCAVFKCSFYEIYQEKIFDLLDPSSSSSGGGLQAREDVKRGVFVEGCSEHLIESVEAAQSLLSAGYRNRHTGDTAMNRASSRSHAVFQIYMTITTTANTVTASADATPTKDSCNTSSNNARKVVTSRFSMVDLAGSERVRDTVAEGGRLKEANVINKSLTALGKVITELSDSNTNTIAHTNNSYTPTATPTAPSTPSSKRRRHVSYRDSKLTFLLKDSLGGHARTVLLATVSAATSNLTESLSTLQFALRARGICNSFTRHSVVEGQTGDASRDSVVLGLQAEVKMLKAELARGVWPLTDSGNEGERRVPMSGGKKRGSLVTQVLTPHKRRSSTSSSSAFSPSGHKLPRRPSDLPFSPLAPAGVLRVDDIAGPAQEDKENSVNQSPPSKRGGSVSPFQMKESPLKQLKWQQEKQEKQEQYQQLTLEHSSLQQLHREAEDTLRARDAELALCKR